MDALVWRIIPSRIQVTFATWSTVTVKVRKLPSKSEHNLTGFIDELWQQIEPADSEEYISKEKNIDDAVVDFFNISKHDFAIDLWDVDEEIKNTETGEDINITHYKEWDF